MVVAHKIHKQRKEARDRAEKQHAKAVEELFARYDADGNGCLKEHEVSEMLASLNKDSTPPSDSELKFIMKMADTKPPQGMLGQEEFMSAINMWRCYCESFGDDNAWGAKIWAKYNKDGEDSLSRSELKLFLADFNEGEPVSEVDLDWVLSKADVLSTGNITKIEMSQAMGAWFQKRAESSRLEKAKTQEMKKSSVCTLM
eukprot:TRINITY_DN64729_c0_g1_i1.p1 TRINITY_DN64729_c0_g1~~TRINITY_DN64729_c0_g1_i1.p1  ORF type:complete len:200 (-),score=44.85 TRINITY_DN64729_c0_g1_i1:56-655(-)